MTPFEEQLKQALARREPSRDFTARVLAEAAQQGRRTEANGRSHWFGRVQMRRFITVTAAFLVISGGAVYEQHRRITRGEAAKENLLMAMQIAGSKLHEAQGRVFHVEITEMAQ